MPTIRLTMAQALLHFLDNQYVELDGVEHKFVHGVMGIFGHGNVTGIGEALEDEDVSLPYIQGHNEQGMVHVAAAFAKQKNRLGIYACTSSIGPGALNMVTAAATATVNRIPVLLLPGDIFACRQPDPVLQQIEIPNDYTVSANDAFKVVSRYFDRIMRPEQLMTAAIQAMRTLTNPVETGAVTLALPQDVQTEAYDYPISFFKKRVHHIDRRRPSSSAVSRAVKLVQASKRPLLIAGGGVHYSIATDDLAKYASAFKIPVAETQAGKSSLTWDHAWNVGAIGVTGSKMANVLARDADLIIAVGTRLADFTTASKTAFSQDVPILSINVAPMDTVKMDGLPLLGDAQEVLAELAGALHAASYQSTYDEDEMKLLKAEWDAEVDRMYQWEHADGFAQTAAIGVVNEFVGDDDVIVNAAGSMPGDLHRLWRVKSQRSYHMEYGFSCMGYEIAGALGVKLAQPHRDVYAFVGDGSYVMLHSELLTAIQEQKKITVLLFDNSGYQCIHNLQRGHGSNGFGNEFRVRDAATNRLTGSSIAIDFCKLAEGLGCTGFRAETREQLQEALALAKDVDGPTLIDIKVLPDTGTDNYESWWRVGVSEVSKNKQVVEAYEAAQSHIERAAKY